MFVNVMSPIGDEKPPLGEEGRVSVLVQKSWPVLAVWALIEEKSSLKHKRRKCFKILSLSQVGTRQHETSKNSDYSHPLVRNSYVGRRQKGIKPGKILPYFFLPWTCTPYSKMAAIQKFPFIFMLISPLCLDCTYRLKKKKFKTTFHDCTFDILFLCLQVKTRLNRPCHGFRRHLDE